MSTASRHVLDLVLAAVIVVGSLFLVLGPRPAGPSERVVPPPPAATFESGAGGLPVARIDVPALASWCRAQGLPAPPDVARCEPALAERLLASLHAAADDPCAETLGELGSVLAALEARRGAEECFRRAAALAPGEMRWRYHVGCLLQESGRSAEAVEWLLAALALDGDHAMTHGRLAHLSLELDDGARAEPHIERYIELAPDDSLGFVLRGRRLLEAGRTAEARVALEKAVAVAPLDFQAHYYLGQAYAALGDERAAEQHLERSRALPQGHWFLLRDPLEQQMLGRADSAQGLVQRFEALSHTQDWATLAELAEGIVQRRAGDTTMMGNLADIYRKQGRYPEAHAILDRAEALEPASRDLPLKRAALCLAEGRLDAALAAADAGLQRDGGSALGSSLRARALLLSGRTSEAELAVRRALALAPDDAGHLLLLGQVLETAGATAEAMATYERVLGLVPGQAVAAAGLARLRGGR